MTTLQRPNAALRIIAPALYLFMFVSGVVGTTAEIYPTYLLLTIRSLFKKNTIVLTGALLIFGLALYDAPLDLLLKYAQIFVIYSLYSSGLSDNKKNWYQTFKLVYISFFVSVLLGQNPNIQDAFFRLTRSYASALDLQLYTGGVAGYAPEPSYMGSLLAAILTNLIVIRSLYQIKDKIPILVYVIAQSIILILLKSLMALLFSLGAFLIYYLLEKNNLKKYTIAITTIIFLIVGITYIDSLGRLDSVFNEIAYGNVRPDSETGSNRGYIFERVINYGDIVGFLWSHRVPPDFQKAVGIADFIAVCFAPIHYIIIILLIFPYKIRRDLRILYSVLALEILFWTPTLLTFQAFALGSVRATGASREERNAWLL